MNLNEMATIANNYTDENVQVSMIRGFINTAISRINAELKTNLPLIEIDQDADEEYTPLEDEWVHTVLIPYACWAIKMNDGSLNEARMYEIQFNEGINILKVNKNSAIDEAYHKDGFNNMYFLNNYKGMPRGNRNKADSLDPLGQGINIKEDDK